VLERVHRVVADSRLVEERQVPDIEVHSPDRQRDDRIREEAQRVHERERRPQDRSREPGEERERRKVAEQHVLQHVEAEELLADRVNGRDKRDEQECDAGRKEPDPPAGDRRSARSQRGHATRVEHRDEDDRDDLQRVERPARVDRQMEQHATSLPSCSSSITTW
jgi:hypothetical protein